MARLADIKRHIAELEREAYDLEGKPPNGKDKITEPISKVEGNESSSPCSDEESSSRSSCGDSPAPKPSPPIQDPGPSNQPGSLPEHSKWYNPALMKRIYCDVPNSSGQPAQQDQTSSQQSRFLPRVKLRLGPETRPATTPQARPEWDRPLFMDDPYGGTGGDDDCIIVGGQAVDNSDVDIREWDLGDSDSSNEDNNTPNRLG